MCSAEDFSASHSAELWCSSRKLGQLQSVRTTEEKDESSRRNVLPQNLFVSLKLALRQWMLSPVSTKNDLAKEKVKGILGYS